MKLNLMTICFALYILVGNKDSFKCEESIYFTALRVALDEAFNIEHLISKHFNNFK